MNRDEFIENAPHLHPAIAAAAKAKPIGTPWQVHSDYEPLQVIAGMDVDNAYIPVCSTDSDDRNAYALDAANARHIVQCVNAHDDLVRFAREFLRLFGSSDKADVTPLESLALRALAKVPA